MHEQIAALSSVSTYGLLAGMHRNPIRHANRTQALDRSSSPAGLVLAEAKAVTSVVAGGRLAAAATLLGCSMQHQDGTEQSTAAMSTLLSKALLSCKNCKGLAMV
jgi:hypothetical protein